MLENQPEPPSLPVKLTYHRRAFWIRWLPLFVAFVGIGLRVLQYAANRALWLDEVSLAINIVNRSFQQLWLPLDHNQGAPIGFLLVERLAVQVLGSSEYALRLWPLMSGIATLPLFYVVAKRAVGRAAAGIGLLCVAISPQLIYYSSEAKQYSSDVALAWLLIGAGFYFARCAGWWRAVLMGLVGAGAVWFSHPAVFVLAGVGLSLAVRFVARREWRRLLQMSLAISCWGLSFFGVYLIALKALAANQVLLQFWQGGFAPLSLSDWKWYLDTFLAVFDNPAGLPQTGLAAAAFCVGIVVLWRTKRLTLAVLMLPLLITLAASALQKYPFSGRLILFLAPTLLLGVAVGVVTIWNQTRERSAVIGYVLIGLLLIQPIVGAVELGGVPRTGEEFRTILAEVHAQYVSGDQLYVYYGARPAYMYYAAQAGFSEPQVIYGSMARNDWQKYFDDINQLRGHGRVWFLFSHVSRGSGVDEELLFLFRLDRFGRQLTAVRAPGAAAYLYDLSSP